MFNKTPATSISATQQDISRLKQIAADAASDLENVASLYVDKIQSQAKRLTDDVQREGTRQVLDMKGRLCDAVNLTRDFAVGRPLVCIGVALAVGVLIGLSRRSIWTGK